MRCEAWGRNRIDEDTEPTSEESVDKKSEEAMDLKLGIIIETKEHEKAWNAMRFAVTAKKSGHAVKVFLMGEGVEIEHLVHERFNVAEQVQAFYALEGEILACGTCLLSRGMEGTPVCPINTMLDCVEMVEWAEKIVTF